MLAEDIYAFRSELASRNTLLAYSGYVSESLLQSLGSAVKRQMELKNAENKVSRRVFSIFVEQVQNIIRYSDEQEWLTQNHAERISGGVVAFGHENNKFFVVCGNTVPRAEAQSLRERLDSIAAMDGDALRKYYRTKLREEPEAQSEGGSIGLLEIARKATQPLQYDFYDMGDDQKFFVLKAFI